MLTEAFDNMFVVFKTKDKQGKANNQKGGITRGVFESQDDGDNQTKKISKNNVIVGKSRIYSMDDIGGNFRGHD